MTDQPVAGGGARPVARVAAGARAVAARGERRARRALAPAAPLTTRARRVVGTMTGTGLGVAAAGVLAWALAGRLGWVELAMVATACLGALALAVPFVLGASALESAVRLEQVRVFAGTPAFARLTVTNRSGRRLLPAQVDLPIGPQLARFDVPSLGVGEAHEEPVVLPTARRCVLMVGPPSSVQADPLGLLRRELASGAGVELYVHPVVTPLPPFGSGLLRDLEGHTTRDLSNSDLAFHTLRDYVPGDDRRYIHWLSSAKAGEWLVRQFLDTRRSRVTVAVDADRASYRDDEEFEVAMSAAASLGVRCLRDELDLTIVAGGQATTPSNATQLLDLLSRGELGGADRALRPSVMRSASLATDTTFAVLVTGSVVPFTDLLGAVTFFGAQVSTVAVRVEPDAPAGITTSGGVTVVAVRELGDLPRLLLAAAA